MLLKRPEKPFSNRLEKRVASYVVTTAAGLAIGAAPSVDAAIVYTSAKEIREPQQAYRPVSAAIDLNHDGQVDFQLVGSFRSESLSFGPFRSASVKCSVGQGNQLADATSTFEGARIAQALKLGQEVGPNLKFSGAGSGSGSFFFSRFRGADPTGAVLQPAEQVSRAQVCRRVRDLLRLGTSLNQSSRR